MTQARTWELLGWQVSPYTAKVRSYMRFKRIPHTERVPSFFELNGRIKRAVGRSIMPTVVAPDGSWMQDSSEIIDALELRFPEPGITPPGARQRLVSSLMELHGDEWLPMVALHYRWHRPLNAAFAYAEFGREGLPWLPGFVSRRLARRVGAKMAGYMPLLGVTEETIPGLEAFTSQLLERLDAHLSEHPFLLGTRPCLGDFSLFGPLWAHLYRDPDTTALFDECPAVIAWMERLRGEPGDTGEFLANDDVPPTLEPILRTMFDEQLVHLVALVEAIDRWCGDNPDATRVPRSLGNTDVFSVGGHCGTRRLITFSQWMLQRVLAARDGLDPADRERVLTWLRAIGGDQLADLEVSHPFERVRFKMRLSAGD